MNSIPSVALGALIILAGASACAQIAPTPPAQAAPALAAPSSAAGGFRGQRGARLEEMRAALKLRPDQEAAFTAYLKETRPDPAMREQMRAAREQGGGAQAGAGSPALEAMRQRRTAATQTFLAVLSPEQQQAFRALRRERRASPGAGGADGGSSGPGTQGAPPSNP